MSHWDRDPVTGQLIPTGGCPTDSQNQTVTFTSSDVPDADASAWTSVTPVASGEQHKSLFAKISQMFKNVRYLYKLLGDHTVEEDVPSGAKFTDTNNKVAQTISTDNSDYRILFSSTADDTTRTEGARKDGDFTYNPSTNNLTVEKINGNDVSTAGILSLLHPVGTIIESTTCDTMAKVVEAYGGTTWIQHSGYMLRGATSSVTANSASNDGGADSVTVSSVASHNHTQNAHKHTQDSHNHTQDSHNHTQNAHGHALTRGNVAVGAATDNKGNYKPSATDWGATNSNMGWVNVVNSTATNIAKTATNQAKTATNQNTTATNIANGANYNVATLPKYKNVYIWERTA